jgi:hypothetical protein
MVEHGNFPFCSVRRACQIFILATALAACSPPEEPPSSPATPGLRIVGDRAVISGCEGELDWNAQSACPWIHCEAAILNSGSVHPYSDINLKGGPVSEDGKRSIVVGTATILRNGPPAPPQYVQCHMEDGKVRDAGVISERDFNEIRYGHKGHEYVGTLE